MDIVLQRLLQRELLGSLLRRRSPISREAFPYPALNVNFKLTPHSLSTLCPPLVMGPIVHYLNSLSGLNTSNQRVRNLMTGQCKSEIPDTGTFIWVDVRDLALAHVKAIELPDAGNKRFFITAGYFSNKEICEIIRKNFPDLEKELPGKEIKGGDYPEAGIYKYDNSRTVNVLGIKFRSLEESIVELVKSLQSVSA
jgi:nucleoside-diphosphate-sugar epimerase